MKSVFHMICESQRGGRALRLTLLSLALLTPAALAADAVAVKQLAAASTSAPKLESTAHNVVLQVQDQMRGLMAGGRKKLDKNPQQFIATVGSVLEPVVDFKYISRAVMGNHARQASAAQRAQFTETFKGGLVATYAKGMVGFADSELAVLPPREDVGGQRRVSVDQEVRSGDGVTNVSYTMAKNRSGEWKLINVVLKGVNLGKTFRNQFDQAMKKSGGDIDEVIAGWSEDS